MTFNFSRKANFANALVLGLALTALSTLTGCGHACSEQCRFYTPRPKVVADPETYRAAENQLQQAQIGGIWTDADRESFQMKARNLPGPDNLELSRQLALLISTKKLRPEVRPASKEPICRCMPGTCPNAAATAAAPDVNAVTKQKMQQVPRPPLPAPPTQ